MANLDYNSFFKVMKVFVQKYKYHLMILIAGFFYSALGICSQVLSNEKVDVFNQIFWRLVFAIIISGIITFIYFRESIKLSKKEVKLLLVNSLILLAGFITITLSIYLGTPAPKAIALSYAYPIPAVVLSYFVLSEKPSRKAILGLVISLISVYVLLEFWRIKNFSSIHFGDLAAIGNSVCFAGLIVYGQKIKKESNISSFKKLFYSLVFTLVFLVLLSYIFKVFDLDILNPVVNFKLSILAWLGEISLALFGTVLSIALIYIAAPKLDSVTTSVLLLTELVWVYLLGFLLFGQNLSAFELIGMAGIVLAIIINSSS